MRSPPDEWRLPQNLAVYWFGFLPAYFCVAYLEDVVRRQSAMTRESFWDQLAAFTVNMGGFLFVIGLIAIPALRWGMTRVASRWSRGHRLGVAIALYPVALIGSGAAISLVTAGVLYGGLIPLLSPGAFVICTTLLAAICEFPNPQTLEAGAAA